MQKYKNPDQRLIRSRKEASRSEGDSCVCGQCIVLHCSLVEGEIEGNEDQVAFPAGLGNIEGAGEAERAVDGLNFTVDGKRYRR